MKINDTLNIPHTNKETISIIFF